MKVAPEHVSGLPTVTVAPLMLPTLGAQAMAPTALTVALAIGAFGKSSTFEKSTAALLLAAVVIVARAKPVRPWPGPQKEVPDMEKSVTLVKVPSVSFATSAGFPQSYHTFPESATP